MNFTMKAFQKLDKHQFYENLEYIDGIFRLFVQAVISVRLIRKARTVQVRIWQDYFIFYDSTTIVLKAFISTI